MRAPLRVATTYPEPVKRPVCYIYSQPLGWLPIRSSTHPSSAYTYSLPRTTRPCQQALSRCHRSHPVRSLAKSPTKYLYRHLHPQNYGVDDCPPSHFHSSQRRPQSAFLASPITLLTALPTALPSYSTSRAPAPVRWRGLFSPRFSGPNLLQLGFQRGNEKRNIFVCWARILSCAGRLGTARHWTDPLYYVPFRLNLPYAPPKNFRLQNSPI
jgi:hypothetical protein